MHDVEPFIFATSFDHNYLPRGLALYESLRKHCPSFHLFVLCLSEECFNILIGHGFANMTPIPLKALEEADPELEIAKSSRSLVEYYFTLSPCFPLYILKNFKDVKIITALDADLLFVHNPNAIFNEIEDNSIALVPHRFSERLSFCEKFGQFNVAWQTFRNNDNGIACLQWWRERCLEWCHDHVEDGKFADQKYLDQVPALFANVKVISHKGANLAPWNIEKYSLCEHNGQLKVDESSVIFLHIQGLKPFWGPFWDTGFMTYRTKMPKLIRKTIYEPYLRNILALQDEYGVFPVALRGMRTTPGQMGGSNAQFEISYWLRSYAQRASRFCRLLYYSSWLLNVQ